MYNIDYSTKEDVKQQNQNRPKISDHSHRILVIGCSGSGK